MDHHGWDGSRYCFLHWELVHTHPLLFSLEDNKIPRVCILHSASSYVGGRGVGGSPFRGFSSVCLGTDRVEGSDAGTDSSRKTYNTSEVYNGDKRGYIDVVVL